ncbi:hypothetical protein TWF788_004999 [Orbilia oligospora]|uniref:Uncharacterized protein n=1 Tax=Orbilia oligospora TaxID=2813651 RepID=A0A6G1ME83_ORBOL|nr:hypothetical protein TWF788_004999 [Orbilia oligospora]KAF3210141.1 hypothetical protein TWF679_006889 [Orbilia oligospora]KAF3254495.1 hypothetical protein TWF192_003257 [Orbilia oligospora]
MEGGLAESTKRLIAEKKESWSYETYTAALWINILADPKFMPINTAKSFLYTPEYFVGNGSRCDLVISQSGLKEDLRTGFKNLPDSIQAIGIPFLAVEFKGSDESDDKVKIGFAQMKQAMEYIATWHYRDQIIFGAVAMGTQIQFYQATVTTTTLGLKTIVIGGLNINNVYKGPSVLDLKKIEDRTTIFKVLEHIEGCRPFL